MNSRHRGPGLARATKAPLFRTRRGWALSREAEEALFRHAEVLSEGALDEARAGYFGSTMVTIDLVAVRRELRGMSDEALAAAVEGSVRVRLRALRWARAEATRRVPELGFGMATVETTVRIVGEKLHLDVDLEMPVEVYSAQGPT